MYSVEAILKEEPMLNSRSIALWNILNVKLVSYTLLNWSVFVGGESMFYPHLSGSQTPCVNQKQKQDLRFFLYDVYFTKLCIPQH